MADKLYAHQERFLAKNPDRRLLVWDTGTGKTRGSIEWANKGEDTALFIVPKSLKENWHRNLRDFFTFRTRNHGHIVTKEQFRRDWDELPRFGQIVVDEGHYFAGPDSAMTKSLRSYIKKHDIKRILIATATPYLSSPWNIYTLSLHLGVHWSYIKFHEHFFEKKYVGQREIAGKKVGRAVDSIKPDMEEDIAKCVAAIGDVVRLDECADVPEQVFENELFELNEEQRAAIKGITDMNPMVRYTKFHQIEGGSLKGDEYEDGKWYHPAQMERLRDIVGANKKVAVVCRYNFQIDMIQSELFRAGDKRFNIYVIRGDVKNRDEIVQKIEAADEAVVLINAACSEGYELPSVPLMVFWSLSFSYKDYKQMLGRILRINKLKKNVYLHLLTPGVSSAVYGSIMKKQDFDIEIYARDQTKGEGLPNKIQ